MFLLIDNYVDDLNVLTFFLSSVDFNQNVNVNTLTNSFNNLMTNFIDHDTMCNDYLIGAQ